MIQIYGPAAMYVHIYPKYTESLPSVGVLYRRLTLKNRLHLDFSLVYDDERTEFIRNYTATSPDFAKYPPTNEEWETMANYILWGKDRKTGLNAKQAGIVDLPSRNGDWNDSAKTVSLDALMESPTFNEAVFSRVPTKVKREVFSRDETIKQCPPDLLPEFRELWRMIDELDIRINYYELAHNKRKNPPREGLLRKFTPE